MNRFINRKWEITQLGNLVNHNCRKNNKEISFFFVVFHKFFSFITISIWPEKTEEKKKIERGTYSVLRDFLHFMDRIFRNTISGSQFTMVGNGSQIYDSTLYGLKFIFGNFQSATLTGLTKLVPPMAGATTTAISEEFGFFFLHIHFIVEEWDAKRKKKIEDPGTQIVDIVFVFYCTDSCDFFFFA